MINNSFGDDQGAGRVGKETADYTFQSSQVGGEFRRSFGIAVEPFLDELNLVTEVVGSGAKGRRVERGFFEADRTAGSEQH
jgi:hypothetical protein